MRIEKKWFFSRIPISPSPSPLNDFYLNYSSFQQYIYCEFFSQHLDIRFSIVRCIIMSSQLNKFRDMLMQMQWNPVELISKHAAFFLVLLFIFILSIGVPIVNNLSSKQYYQDSMTKLVYAFLNSSYMLTKQFKWE